MAIGSMVASDGTATIELRLRELAQLFNSPDPSPFHERDLDDDAEDNENDTVLGKGTAEEGGTPTRNPFARSGGEKSA